jgi:hypothetical protein
MLMQKCYIYVLGPLYDFRCAFQEKGIMHFRKGALIPSFGVGLGWADPQKKREQNCNTEHKWYSAMQQLVALGSRGQ